MILLQIGLQKSKQMNSKNGIVVKIEMPKQVRHDKGVLLQ
jgi:hypothetical protein